jgi:serine/threonine-protein kinase BUR1
MPSKKPPTPRAVLRSPDHSAIAPGPPEKPDETSKPEISSTGRRMVVKWSRKEEENAYGRIFVGCGAITDYDVTTKLGEGTFG